MNKIPELRGFETTRMILERIQTDDIDDVFIDNLSRDYLKIAVFAHPRSVRLLSAIRTQHVKDGVTLKKHPLFLLAMAVIIDAYNIHVDLIRKVQQKRFAELLTTEYPEEVLYFYRIKDLVELATHDITATSELVSRVFRFTTLHAFVDYLFDVMNINI